MTADPARSAAVNAALKRIRSGMTLGLGSGRATFALTERLHEFTDLRAVAASPATEKLAVAAGVVVVSLDGSTRLDIAFDGADEVNGQLQMIKGGGAAALREKLVITAANEVVIMVEEPKLVDQLGSTRRLPVDIAAYGWETTAARVSALVSDWELRRNHEGLPVETAEGNYLLDVAIPDGNIHAFAAALKATLGVVEHGLFLDEGDLLLVGHPDGSVTTLNAA